MGPSPVEGGKCWIFSWKKCFVLAAAQEPKNFYSHHVPPRDEISQLSDFMFSTCEGALHSKLKKNAGFEANKPCRP
jgi:hypothetical protein